MARSPLCPVRILHYTCNSFEEHRQRLEFYTDLAAREMFDRHESAGFFRRALGPMWIFFNTYVLRLGFLDGAQGYLIARMAAHYVARKYSKLRHLQRKLNS